MAFLVKKGSFSAPTSTGSSAVTGVGFEPKAVIFWLTSQTATGYAANKRFSFGFGVSASEQACCAYTSDDASGVGTTIGSRQSDAHVLFGITCSGGVVSVELAADLLTLDSDGFTLDFGTTSGGTAYIVHYLALGGDEITGAFVGNALSRTTVGTQGYTGVGFQPDALIAMTLARAAPATPSSFTGTRFALGAASGPTERFALQVQEDNVMPTSVNSIEVSDKIIYALSGAAADFIVADLDSFDADGFTLDWTTANGTARVFYYLALQGGNYLAGVETQKTSTGTKATSGVGFQPDGLLLMGTNRAASASADTTLEKLSVGGSDGTTEGATWASGTDNVSTTDENVASLTDKILRHATNPSTTNAEADLSSFDADGFTLDWTTADATAREFGYLAFGSEAANRPMFPPMIYGRGAC